MSCGANADLDLIAGAGQTMNISLWNFKPSTTTLGTLTDKLSGNMVELVGVDRFLHVTSSVGSEITLKLVSRHAVNFMIEITG